MHMTEPIMVVVAKYEGTYFNKLSPTYNFRVLTDLGTGGGFGYTSPTKVGEILRELSELNDKKDVEFAHFNEDDLGIFVQLPHPKPLNAQEMAEVKMALSGK